MWVKTQNKNMMSFNMKQRIAHIEIWKARISIEKERMKKRKMRSFKICHPLKGIRTMMSSISEVSLKPMNKFLMT